MNVTRCFSLAITVMSYHMVKVTVDFVRLSSRIECLVSMAYVSVHCFHTKVDTAGVFLVTDV